MGYDFQNAFYIVYAVPIAILLAFLLAGTVVMSVMRLILNAFTLVKPRRSSREIL